MHISAGLISINVMVVQKSYARVGEVEPHRRANNCNPPRLWQVDPTPAQAGMPYDSALCHDEAALCPGARISVVAAWHS